MAKEHIQSDSDPVLFDNNFCMASALFGAFGYKVAKVEQLKNSDGGWSDTFTFTLVRESNELD